MKAYFHKVLTPLKRSFVVRHDVVPEFGKLLHYHEDLELHLTIQGEGIRLIGDNISPFHPGEILLLGKNLPHSWHSTENYTNAEINNVEAIVIQFGPHCFGNDFFSLPELAHIEKLLMVAQKGICIHKSLGRKIRKKMFELEESANFKRMIILLEILDWIASSEEYHTIATSQYDYNNLFGEDALRLERIFEYTLRNFRNEISLSEIAAVSNLTITSFCRYFKSVTKKTYFNFLLEIRVKHVCQMIIEDKYSVAAISAECGFNNVSNFYRHFKRIMGMTPADYKKKFLKDIAA